MPIDGATFSVVVMADSDVRTITTDDQNDLGASADVDTTPKSVQSKKYRKPSKKHSRKVTKQIEEWKKKQAEKEAEKEKDSPSYPEVLLAEPSSQNQDNCKSEPTESEVEQLEIEKEMNKRKTNQSEKQATTTQRIQEEWSTKFGDESTSYNEAGRHTHVGKPIKKTVAETLASVITAPEKHEEEAGGHFGQGFATHWTGNEPDEPHPDASVLTVASDRIYILAREKSDAEKESQENLVASEDAAGDGEKSDSEVSEPEDGIIRVKHVKRHPLAKEDQFKAYKKSINRDILLFKKRAPEQEKSYKEVPWNYGTYTREFRPDTSQSPDDVIVETEQMARTVIDDENPMGNSVTSTKEQAAPTGKIVQTPDETELMKSMGLPHKFGPEQPKKKPVINKTYILNNFANKL